VGAGLYSNETSVTPVFTPGAPTGLSATAGNAQVGLTWTAAASNGGSAVSSYNVYEGTTSGGETLTASATTTSYTATGLTDGTTFL
jgi:hypothetical protein